MHALVDDRLGQLDLPERQRYRDRLRQGSGFDSEHADLLRKLRANELTYRNTSNGYWIAEADSVAASS